MSNILSFPTKFVESDDEQLASRAATAEDYLELEYQLANMLAQLARLQAALIQDLAHKTAALDEACGS